MKHKTPKELWKIAWKLARQPDLYLADDVYKLDCPIRYLIYANIILKKQGKGLCE